MDKIELFITEEVHVLTIMFRRLELNLRTIPTINAEIADFGTKILLDP